MKRIAILAFAGLMGVFAPGLGAEDCLPSEYQLKIVNPVTTLGALHVGKSVSISGNLIATSGGPGAYIFDADSGVLLNAITLPGGSFPQLEGSLLVTISPHAVTILDALSGAVVSTFPHPDAASGNTFRSVSYSDGLLALGSVKETNPLPIFNTVTRSNERVIIMDAATGAVVSTIDNPVPLPEGSGDNFGHTTCIDGGLVAVGAYSARVPNGGGALVGAGIAYVFDVATGGLVSTLNSPNPVAGQQFSIRLLSGDIAIAGSVRDSSSGVEESGRLYVFNATTGDLLRTMDSPTLGFWDHFGNSVSSSGDNLLVTAPNAGPVLAGNNGLGAGLAYIYSLSSGDLLATLSSPDPAVSDYFGDSAAIDGSHVVIGDTCEEPLGTYCGNGALYTFACSPAPTPTPTPGDCDYDHSGCINIADFLILLDHWGENGGPGQLIAGLVQFLQLLDQWLGCH